VIFHNAWDSSGKLKTDVFTRHSKEL
jgi:hypothetical protein